MKCQLIWLLHLLFSVIWHKKTTSIPIDNGLIGDPQVECGQDEVIVRLNTQRPFQGRVFVKGMVDIPDCVRDAASDSPLTFPTELEIAIPLGTCNMQRQRMLDPIGMQQSLTVIISFHPIFLTKVDKAYNIRCFYMSAEQHFTHVLLVSMMTTESLSETIAPKCEYTVRKGSKDGPLVRYTTIGEKLYHVWQCDLDPNDGIVVRNCYINGGSDGRVQALDIDGCPVDQYVMSYLTYDPDLQSAWVETHAFKFADRAELNFECEPPSCTAFGNGAQPPAPTPRPTQPYQQRRIRGGENGSYRRPPRATAALSAPPPATMDLVPQNEEIYVLFTRDHEQLDEALNDAQKQSQLERDFAGSRLVDCGCQLTSFLALCCAITAFTACAIGALITYRRHTTLPKIVTQ